MIHGILLLDKPAGISSNVALQQVRRLFDWNKAGHTGTLDPLATGLLPVCLGEATKFSHSLLNADKTYEATIRLGFVSSTGDAEGCIEESGRPEFSPARLREVLHSFTGSIHQVPPMHSALKKDGRPLYSYARAGEEVRRESREVAIKELELVGYEGNTLSLRTTCTKGTYIRVLAEDIGKALGSGGYLLALRRTGISDLDINGAIALEELGTLSPAARAARLLPVDRLVKNLPAAHLDAQAAQRVLKGQSALASSRDVNSGLVRLYDAAGGFLGVGEGMPDGTVVPKRMIANPIPVEKPVVNP